jgi:serine/threonine protein phosphatase PrpC
MPKPTNRQYFYSQPGPKAIRNSDAGFIWSSDSHTVLCVCDGVSSSRYSAESSRLAIKVIADACAQQNDWADPLSLAEIWADHAHQAISQKYNYKGLSTIVLAIVSGTDVWGTYAGDSLCLLVPQTGEAVCLTEPHSRSVVRMQNGKTVLRDGMPIFDKGMTQALGQPGVLQTDGFTAKLPSATWLVCFSDGVDERLLVNFLKGSVINTETVSAFVGEAGKHTNDDATLVLFQSAPNADQLQLADRMANYANLDPVTRDMLLGQFDHTIQIGQCTDILAAYQAEDDDRRASRLAGILLSSGELERQTAISMLTAAVMRKQSETCELLKRKLVFWR